MRRALERLQSEDGFGLIELTIAMSILAIGLLSLLASFTAGYVTLNRAATTGTASVLADNTMEAYRGKQYTALTPGTTTTTYSATTNPASPDGKTYTVTSIIATSTATNTSGTTARSTKLVTINVTNSLGTQLASEQSTFDALTGQ